MLHILQVLPDLNQSGVSYYVLDLLQASTSIKNMRMSVCAGRGSLEGKISSYFPLSLTARNPYRILKNAIRLYQICKKENISLIHVHSRGPGWSVWIATRFLKIPYVSTYHGAYSSNFFKNFYNSVMVRGQICITVSNYIYKRVAFFYPKFKKNLMLMHQGIDASFYKLTTEEEKIIKKERQERSLPIIFLPGRLTKIKGHKFLIDCLIKMGKSVHFMINKPQSFKEQKLFEILKENVPNYIHLSFAPPSQKIAYHISDMVVAPSKRPEAFGRVVAEALFSDKPILTAYHGGVIDITDEPNFFYQPGNDEDFIKKIENLLCMNDNILKKMVQVQKEKISNKFDIKKCASDIFKLYQQVYDAYPHY